jgi:hypothetical protein
MAIMIPPDWAKPADPAHAIAQAATAALKNQMDGKGRSLFSSKRNLLDSSSVAQSLDGMAV